MCEDVWVLGYDSVWQRGTNVSEDSALSIFKAESGGSKFFETKQNYIASHSRQQ